MEILKESDRSTTAWRKLQQVMRQHPLFFFFVMAYAFSWIVSIPYILEQWGILHGNFIIIFAIKSFGPFLAAYIMTRITEGKEGVLRLRQSIRQVRAGWQWYLFILLGIPVLALLGIILLPGALASFQGFPPHFLVTYLVSFILIFFGGGPLGEEPGWRGFALPRLQPTLWTFAGDSAPGCLVGLLAFAGLPDGCPKERTRCQLYHPAHHQLPYFFPDGNGHGDHLYVGLQPHPWQRVHRHLTAYQHQYLWYRTAALHCPKHDQN